MDDVKKLEEKAGWKRGQPRVRLVQSSIHFFPAIKAITQIHPAELSKLKEIAQPTSPPAMVRNLGKSKRKILQREVGLTKFDSTQRMTIQAANELCVQSPHRHLTE